jgi:hypothetical protein
MKTNLNGHSQGKQAFAKVAAVVLILSMLLAGSAAPAHAQSAITFNLVQEIPIVYSQYMPCATAGVGEVLDFSGSLKMTIHGTLTEDGLATFSAKMVPTNLIGVGQTSGDEYRLVGETGATHTYSIELGTAET